MHPGPSGPIPRQPGVPVAPPGYPRGPVPLGGFQGGPPPPQPFAGPMPWHPAPPRRHNTWEIVAAVVAVVLVLILAVIGIYAATRDDNTRHTGTAIPTGFALVSRSAAAPARGMIRGSLVGIPEALHGRHGGDGGF
ncbi:hypothetical protein A5645_12230 [Mycobacterium asiaticum]|nr:hypothetical protein A5645_12230 [Mycobacterium asiaticum]